MQHKHQEKNRLNVTEDLEILYDFRRLNIQQ